MIDFPNKFCLEAVIFQENSSFHARKNHLVEDHLKIKKPELILLISLPFQTAKEQLSKPKQGSHAIFIKIRLKTADSPMEFASLENPVAKPSSYDGKNQKKW